MRMTHGAHDRAQGEANLKKIELARTLVGKQVIIDGMPRKVTDYSRVTGDAEIRIGLRVHTYDPRMLVVVEKAQAE